MKRAGRGWGWEDPRAPTEGNGLGTFLPDFHSTVRAKPTGSKKTELSRKQGIVMTAKSTYLGTACTAVRGDPD